VARPLAGSHIPPLPPARIAEGLTAVILAATERKHRMIPDRYKGRTLPGPVTLAACLLNTIEQLYARVIAVARAGGQDEVADASIAEFEAWRDEWRPLLERILDRGR